MIKKENSKDMSLIIKQEEMVLMKISTEIYRHKEIYGNLSEAIQNYNSLSKNQLENDVAFDDKAKAVLLNFDSKNAMLENIKAEWISTDHRNISEVKIPCKLCNTPNLKICYIKNKNTGKEINVGTTCIEKFVNTDELKRYKKSVEERYRDREKQRKKVEFDEKEGEPEYLENASEKYKNFPILIPYNLNKAMEISISKMKEIKAEFINGNVNLNDKYAQYVDYKKRFNESYNRLEKYYEQVKDNPLVCKKRESDWLRKYKPNIWEQISQNGGIYTKETLQNISSEEFIKEKMDIFKNKLRDKDVTLIGIEGANIKFSIRNTRYLSPVLFFMKRYTFMKNIGCYCLTEEAYTWGKSDFYEFSILKNYKNAKALYNGFSKLLLKQGYDIVFDDRVGFIYWMSSYKGKNDNILNYRFARIDIDRIIVKLSTYFMKDEDFFVSRSLKFEKEMSKGVRWMTEQEKNEQIRSAIEMEKTFKEMSDKNIYKKHRH